MIWKCNKIIFLRRQIFQLFIFSSLAFCLLSCFQWNCVFCKQIKPKNKNKNDKIWNSLDWQITLKTFYRKIYSSAEYDVLYLKKATLLFFSIFHFFSYSLSRKGIFSNFFMSKTESFILSIKWCFIESMGSFHAPVKTIFKTITSATGEKWFAIYSDG